MMNEFKEEKYKKKIEYKTSRTYAETETWCGKDLH